MEQHKMFYYLARFRLICERVKLRYPLVAFKAKNYFDF